MTSAEPARVVELRPRRSRARAAIVSLRPRQWSKNLLLFAGIVFAAKLGDAVRWGEATAIFVAYCAASSAAYLVNDLRDAEDDRQHPVKRYRPIARGELQPEHALVLAAVLATGAVAIAAALGFASLLLLLAFVALQLGYSLGLKRIVFVDVLVIAGLFVIRAAAGAAAVDVPISGWLLVCTALLALFLGLAKRRGELVLVEADATPGRPALAGYSLTLVDVVARTPLPRRRRWHMRCTRSPRTRRGWRSPFRSSSSGSGATSSSCTGTISARSRSTCS